MRDRMVTKFLSVVMMLVFPASIMMAETNAAMLYSSGHAMLNGTGVAHSTAVFAGDKIQTAQDSAATIHGNGSTVLVPANSSVQFQGDGIDLESGSAVVSTTKGLKAKVDDLTVRPVNGSAKFEVIAKNGDVLIAARTGSLSLTDANGTTYLQEGGTTTKSKKGAIPGIGTTTATPDDEHRMRTALAVFLGIAAVAAAVAIVIASTNSPGAVSPGQP